MFICTHQILGTFQETSKFSSRIKKPYRKENPETIHPQFLKNTDPFASRQQHVACIRTNPECISIPNSIPEALGRTLITPTPGTMPAPGRN